MKTCPVCEESYDGNESVGQECPDICPACNRAFFTLDPEIDGQLYYDSLRPDLDGESYYNSPLPTETPEQCAKRLEKSARELLVLELCERLLAELTVLYEDKAEYWELKRKLAERMLTFLREIVPEEYLDSQPPLSDEEEDDIIKNHPLLLMSLPEAPRGVAVSEHLEKVRSRVRSYLRMREAASG